MSDYAYILAEYAICDRRKSRNFAAEKRKNNKREIGKIYELRTTKKIVGIKFYLKILTMAIFWLFNLRSLGSR